MPFHFPGMLGSKEVLSTQVPYLAGALGLSIWNGLPPRKARGTTPWTFSLKITGGGAGFFTGRLLIGAVNVCGAAMLTAAVMINKPKVR